MNCPEHIYHQFGRSDARVLLNLDEIITKE